jgi:RNA polymerase sigma factor (sigma-70 family)
MSPGIPTRLLATQSDERLLALVRQGHERAFEAIVQRYRKPLLSYCRRLPLPEARAEDIIQLALLKTWIAVREGAEVHNLKAWLYRVVHNTAVNAARDAAHDGEPLADPARRVAANEPDVGLGLTVREALAEVAALPPLQREVIVRTAVAGHSHEQVASDLGITGGAVRGLLYRARATLRTAATALVPPPLLSWLLGRADQSGPAPERLAELAGGGGTVGLGGLLLKGGVVAITAGTVLTGAAIVHISGSTHHRARHRLAATASAGASAAGSSSAPPAVGLRPGGLSSAGSRSRHTAQRSGRGSRGTSHARVHAGSRSAPSAHPPVSLGGQRGRTGLPPAQVRGNARHGAPSAAPVVQSPSPTSSSGQAPGQGGGSSQGSGSGQSGGSDTGQSAPVGSAASSGSGGQPGAGSSPVQGSGEGGGGAAPSGGQSGSSSGSGSGSSEGSSSSGQGSSGGSEPPSGSGGEQSGSLVGTVVHEVGNVLEHLLH